MKYQELNEILYKAAKEKRVVDAFVTFTPNSFENAYTQFERTYLFTSNNKAFASPSWLRRHVARRSVKVLGSPSVSSC